MHPQEENNSNMGEDGGNAVFTDCVEYLNAVHSKCGLGVQPKAVATASEYFRRVCLQLDITQEPNPRLVILTCLFIAGKTEQLRWKSVRHGHLQNRGFEIHDLIRASGFEPPIIANDLIAMEEFLLSCLEFDLIPLSSDAL